MEKKSRPDTLQDFLDGDHPVSSSSLTIFPPPSTSDSQLQLDDPNPAPSREFAHLFR